MRYKYFSSGLLLFLIILLIFSSIFFSGLKLIHRSSVEYDEGAYLTTFLLVDKGNTLYQKTFFSQFPGFFYATYPQFLLFGKNLEAGRLAVFIWSLAGLLGILWFSYEAGNILFGILVIAILYNIPLFFDQSLTFHADSIPFTFSILALSSMLRFKNKYKFIWFVLSVLFFGFGVLVKLDASTFPPLLLLFLASAFKERMYYKRIFFSFLSFLLLPIVLLYFSILPFGGLVPFYNSFISVRLNAVSGAKFSLLTFFSYLSDSKSLLLFVALAIIFSFIGFLKKKNDRLLFVIILLWSLTVFFFLMIYRPLFFHHLVFLAVPFALLFSYLLITYLKEIVSLKLLKIGIFLFTLFTIFNFISFSLSIQKQKNDLQEEGIEIINKNTKKTDYVVSDDGFLNAFSDRLPPPWLTDISDVRISSGALTSNDFEKNILQYKPKLIMSWSGRVKKIKGFHEIIQKANYKSLIIVDKDHEAFILE